MYRQSTHTAYSSSIKQDYRSIRKSDRWASLPSIQHNRLKIEQHPQVIMVVHVEPPSIEIAAPPALVREVVCWTAPQRYDQNLTIAGPGLSKLSHLAQRPLQLHHSPQQKSRQRHRPRRQASGSSRIRHELQPCHSSNARQPSSLYRNHEVLTSSQENTPERLKWRGSLPLIFTGDHVFEFQPSKKTPGATTLVQYEDFSGLLSFTMKTEKRSGADNHKGFVAFNEDVKKEAERKQAAATAA